MKKYIILGLLLGGLQGMQAQTVVKPSVKSKTTFAIVVDQKSYDAAKAEIDAYRASVENEGLGTYLLIDDWKRPEPIREQLIKLHADKKAPLEGCVLVGDIPIAMVRDAHHLTSAFKMSPKADWQESSVPSDRYYDDFGLTFDYIKQDSAIADYHYVSLRADGEQYIMPDIYSARIRPLKVEGMDKYQQIRDYLKKAVAEKQSRNVLDQLTMARGHGYNSEDLAAWSGEQLALREQLPQLFKAGNVVKFYDFETQYPAKPDYLNEIQREGLDIMLFHHHGGPTTQYLNGYENGSGIELSIENIKRYLRSRIKRLMRKDDRETAINKCVEAYKIPREWCEEVLEEGFAKEDSIYSANMDIYAEDIHKLTPNARFVLFDACYNGSFHMDDNMVGAYIFAKGKTIATMGCTVNTIQDKWPDEFLGLMAEGMRIGQFTRFTCFLENHLAGDPTFHFVPNGALDSDINQAIVLQEGNIGFWKKQLASPSADMQAMALRQLEMAGYEDMVDLLEQSYFESDKFVVRLEAMRLLALNYPTECQDVLKVALNDTYELIRRFATEYVERNSDPELTSAWAESFLMRGHEKRHHFRVTSAMDAFTFINGKEELEKHAGQWTWYDRSRVDAFIKRFDANKKSMEKDFAVIVNPESSDKQVSSEIRIFRNNPITPAIYPLLQVLKNEKRGEEVRGEAAETLGWYNLHYGKAEIINTMKGYKTSNEKVMNEVRKTINRLEGKNR
ncbi:MAG: HEAT repeat domain-containing protein [Bacteroides sp.]|nr:HEAT repeat domain-containing protein [Bacteroides sp.]